MAETETGIGIGSPIIFPFRYYIFPFPFWFHSGPGIHNTFPFASSAFLPCQRGLVRVVSDLDSFKEGLEFESQEIFAERHPPMVGA